jgi:hypothetical protein
VTVVGRAAISTLAAEKAEMSGSGGGGDDADDRSGAPTKVRSRMNVHSFSMVFN